MLRGSAGLEAYVVRMLTECAMQVDMGPRNRTRRSRTTERALGTGNEEVVRSSNLLPIQMRILTTKHSSIIDFELWRETTQKPDEKIELQRWGLERKPPATSWFAEWNAHGRWE